MKRILRYIISGLIVLAITATSAPAVFAQQGPAISSLLISEVQTGGLTVQGTEDGRQEFIELYNSGETPVNLDGLHLEYLSASHTGVGSATRILAALSGVVPDHGVVVVGYPGYMTDADFIFTVPAQPSSSGLLARTGGHIRLVDGQGMTIDLVGWGTAVGITPWWKSVEIPAGMSIQRILPGDNRYTTGTAFQEPSATLTPRLPTPLELPSESSEEPLPPVTACRGVVLSEILPNAAGADTGKEFIEIQNMGSEAVSLRGCQLQVGEALFDLPDEVLAAGVYRAFYDSETGITLPNASAQAIWLKSDEGLQSVTYADNMNDNTSWALITGNWRPTTVLTPGTTNILGLPVAAPKPVAVSASSAQACAVGKERNPTTNRCRTIATVAASSAACKPNQERNPETNRCRAIQAASTTPKPCAIGQERNAVTNRCRKVTVGTASHLAAVKDVRGSTIATNYRWWVAGSIILGVMAYGAYEWRHDLANVAYRLKVRWHRKTRPDAPD